MHIVNLIIDGREVAGRKGQTILDAALENDIQIPTFCHDKRLAIYGACGICVVEAEGVPKLLRACATEIAEGMSIKTDTPRVRESRKVNLELLLSQHTGDCRAPCGLACPAQTDCQGYVGLIANGEMEEALKLIKTKIPLAASIGRVCPHPCEEECRRKLVEEPISILNLKRYAADIDLGKPEPYLPEIAPPTGKRVAIVGGGPGGLSCAYYLAEQGHSVTVFEAMPKMGGMLRYGIPEYRLPKEIVDKETALIEKMGVVFKNNVRIGQDMTFGALKESYDATVIAIGAWVSMPLPCPGAGLNGVYGGIDFLRKAYLGEPISMGKNVAIVGGGNTAMDACRTAVRLGAENVYIIYRRTRAEMPAEDIEITEAEEEGVIFKYLVNPLEIIGNNNSAAKMRLQKMKLGEPDASGRRRPEPIKGEEEILEVDTVIAALGQGIVPEGFAGIKLTRGNTIVADEQSFTTSEKGVFAIGDCINEGASIAIKSIADAKKAAISVHGFLAGIETSHKAPYRVARDDLTEADFADRKKEPRSQAPNLGPDDRRNNFLEVLETYDTEMAVKEASRCLECGCHDYFECKLIAFADLHDVEPDRFRESVPKVEFKDDHPFILRDPNKCILCGLCVRICDELVGSAALGFVERGFDTVVKPAFEDPLKDTTCISCGQCITVCPTGALQERISIKKPVPLDTTKTDSICGICAVGCSMRVESYGGLLVKTTPAAERGMTGRLDSRCGIAVHGINNGMMCGRGRFGINYVQKDGRLTAPLLRKNGELLPVSWDEAIGFTAKEIERLRLGGKKIAVSIGHTYCVEDAGAIISLAKLLDADAFSFMNRENGLMKVLGCDGSPNTLDEVHGCDEILVFGSSLLQNPVILAKLRLAAKNGAAVTVVAAGGGEFNLPCAVLNTPDSTVFIKQVNKALTDAGCNPKNAEGFSALKASLSATQVSGDAKKLADRYRAASSAMILFALDELSEAAVTELANMAVIAGHIGSPGKGIFMLRQMSGSQVLADYAVTATVETAKGSKGLMIFGEDPEIWSGDNCHDFLMVQDMFLTDTAKKADVVFPMAAYPEIDGTYVNTERRVQQCNKAITAPMEYRTYEIVQKIAQALGGSDGSVALGGFAAQGESVALGESVAHVEFAAPCGSVVPNVPAASGEPVAPGVPSELYPDTKPGDCYPAPVLCADGFGFPDKKAKLQTVAESPMFAEAMRTSSLLKAIDADLPRPKI